MILVSFDPGLRDAGLAIWKDGKLQRATLVRSPEKKERGPFAWMQMAKAVAEQAPSPDRCVIEIPQVYQQRFWKGDPADLIELAGVNGAVVARLDAHEHHGYRPREWKGQTPKDVHGKRIMKALSAEEASRIDPCPASLLHNVIDSIGIGLFDLGRL